MSIDLSKLPPDQRATIERLDHQTRQAVELLAEARANGFTFSKRIHDGPELFGKRQTELWRDTVYLGAVGSCCSALREIRNISLSLEPVNSVTGSAAEVISAVLRWT
jgi:hypothetical protein